MEIAAVAAQQAQLKNQVGLAAVKSQAQAQQALVNVIQGAIQSGSRGGNLNITV